MAATTGRINRVKSIKIAEIFPKTQVKTCSKIQRILEKTKKVDFVEAVLVVVGDLAKAISGKFSWTFGSGADERSCLLHLFLGPTRLVVEAEFGFVVMVLFFYPMDGTITSYMPSKHFFVDL